MFLTTSSTSAPICRTESGSEQRSITADDIKLIDLARQAIDEGKLLLTNGYDVIVADDLKEGYRKLGAVVRIRNR